ncbi:MAG TPA: hypothetical protein PKI11_17725 [Candidatus Hydrogenedentes bacterium]|nr:hypothetical protein [Candidatus Hydrogenedentota bacterium]
MDLFPAVDPIPLPAPVWLFKVLHSATLALHFTAVHLLVGGLAMAAFWALVGRMRGDEARLNASGALAYRLPVAMAYVINLGVPPLLFAQVLYGRALYTSSVIIGLYWISVVFLVIAAYFVLYMMAKRAENGVAYGWLGLIALAIVLKVAVIYTNNMTLMLRPDAWIEMYRNNPVGGQLNGDDPTVLPRWLFMMIGSLGVAGVGLILLGMKTRLPASATLLLRRRGGLALAAFTLLQVALAWRVLAAQPESVRTALAGHAFYRLVALLWLATAVLLVALGLFAAVRAAKRSWLSATLCGAAAFVNILLMVLFRDGIRDMALLQFGYDVWAREINTNWAIVMLFLALFVGAAGLVAWMAAVTARAKGVDETYA